MRSGMSKKMNTKKAVSLFGVIGTLFYFFHVIFGSLFYRTGSIYLEAGYLQHYLNNELVGGVSIGIGTRSFFR